MSTNQIENSPNNTILHQDESIETEEEILEKQIEQYISTLNEREKLVLEIAKEHLQSSFCIERSVGFVKWKNSKNNIMK
jgi:DNA-directed RNA polymerase specialized sigma subunit